MEASKPKSQRKRANNDERMSVEAKRRKKYDSRRIYLGHIADERERQRRLSGQTHSTFAEHLLSVHSQHCMQTGCTDRVDVDRLVK